MNGKQRLGLVVISTTFAVVTLTPTAPAGATSPDAPKEDVFGRTTAPPPHRASARVSVPAKSTKIMIHPSELAPAPPHPIVSQGSPPQQWFDAFDTFVAVYRPTTNDESRMKMPFNQEVERVTAFSNTVAKIARNYRILAQQLNALPIPSAVPDSKDYRDMMVGWYKDSALVYEDMVRPRPPARTKEELNAMIQDLTNRSENLKSQSETLAKMDTDMRRHYNVTPPSYDDALRSYAGHH